MEYEKYLQLKSKGLFTYQKTGDIVVISAKRFDPTTGDELAPYVESIDVQTLNTTLNEVEERLIQDLAAVQEKLKGLREFKKDVKK